LSVTYFPEYTFFGSVISKQEQPLL